MMVFFIDPGGRHWLCKVFHIYVDLVHALHAIIEGLDEHLTWSDDNCRCDLAAVYPGILRGCIGVGDVKEYEIEKPKDSVKEKKSLSGKKKLIVARCLV
jgi:hypothetical protein